VLVDVEVARLVGVVVEVGLIEHRDDAEHRRARGLLRVGRRLDRAIEEHDQKHETKANQQ
jgi:hypothetical protein